MLPIMNQDTTASSQRCHASVLYPGRSSVGFSDPEPAVRRVFDIKLRSTPRVGVAIGDCILDLAVLESEGLIDRRARA